MAELNSLTSLLADAVAYWRFEGDSTDAVGSNDGTDTAITYSAGNGKYGQGAGFNGTTSKIALASSPHTGTGSFTINTWIKTSATGVRREIISYGNATSNQAVFLFVNTSNKLAFDLFGVAGTASTDSITDGNWHMVSVRNTAGTIQLFIDGVANGSSASMSPNIGAGSGYKWIGHDGGSSFFSGAIDDVSVFTRALTSDELLQLYRDQLSSMFLLF